MICGLPVFSLYNLNLRNRAQSALMVYKILGVDDQYLINQMGSNQCSGGIFIRRIRVTVLFWL